jgi:hypothetical protein
MPGPILKTVLILFALLGLSHGQDAKFTALFITNFARYIEWPSEQSRGDFVVTVLGNDQVTEELKIIAEKTMVGEQRLVIRKCLTTEALEKSHIIYVAPEKSECLAGVLEKFGSGPTLIVTNKKGLAQAGAAINLAMIAGKQRYEINPASLKKSGLGAKPVLFKLGTVIGS